MASFATLSLKAQLQTSDENWNAVIAALSKHTQPRILYGPNSNGANVFSCCDAVVHRDVYVSRVAHCSLSRTVYRKHQKKVAI